MKRGIYIVCMMLVLFGGCKSRRAAERKGAGKDMSVTELLEAVRKNEPRFEHAQAGKISVTLVYQERKMTFGGSISVLADSLAVLSVQPLFGIELFRAELRKDSVLLVDKMNRRYAVLPLRLQGMDLRQRKTLQDMVSNRMFTVCDATSLEPRRMALQKTDTHYVLSFDDPEYGMLHYTYHIDAQTFRIKEAQLAVSGTTVGMHVRYDDMRPADGIVFPHVFDFAFTMPDGQQMSCRISLLRLSFQEQVHIVPANVGRYEQIGLFDLLRK